MAAINRSSFPIAPVRVFVLAMLILGCDGPGSGPIGLPPLSPYRACPGCQHAQFVVSQMVLPQNRPGIGHEPPLQIPV